MLPVRPCLDPDRRRSQYGLPHLGAAWPACGVSLERGCGCDRSSCPALSVCFGFTDVLCFSLMKGDTVKQAGIRNIRSQSSGPNWSNDPNRRGPSCGFEAARGSVRGTPTFLPGSGRGQSGVGLVNPNAGDADQVSIRAFKIGTGCLSEGRRGGWGGIPASRPSVPMQTDFRTY